MFKANGPRLVKMLDDYILELVERFEKLIMETEPPIVFRIT
jgi:hypothetical protein